MCSWWKLGIGYPYLREKCSTALNMVSSYNITHKGQRCQLCSIFEPDTPQHILIRCPFSDDFRRGFAQTILKGLGFALDADMMSFLLDGWVKLDVGDVGTIVVTLFEKENCRRGRGEKIIHSI